MEYYATGKMYEITVNGEKLTVYENEADGQLYTSKDFTESTRLVFVDEMTHDDTKYTVTQNNDNLQLTLGDKIVTVVFYESAKISGTNRYKLDGINGIYAEVTNDTVRLVTEQKIYETIQESGQCYTYELP